MPGIKDFSWSPTSNVIAFWVPEYKDVPARVSLIEIPRYECFNFSLNLYLINFATLTTKKKKFFVSLIKEVKFILIK